MNTENRITELEIKLTETMRLAEELSDVVADQAKRLELAERRIDLLLQRAADAEQNEGSVAIGNQPPPHW